MPRTARHESISSSDIYHVLVRGINKQNIFLDDEDKQKFIETIKIYKKKYKFSLLAYSIMDNHVHLVLEDNKHNLPETWVFFPKEKETNQLIPSDAIPCSGKCSQCSSCWTLKKGQCVVFKKH